jgi:hypothetical protein
MGQITLRRDSQPRASALRQKRQARTARAARQTYAATTRPTWEPRRRAPVSRARRRYDIALGQPGVEVSLPGIPLALNARTLAIFLSLLCGAGMMFFFTGAAFEAGVPAVRETTICRRTVPPHPAWNQNVFNLSPLDGRLVAANPGVRQVRMTLDGPIR